MFECSPSPSFVPTRQDKNYRAHRQVPPPVALGKINVEPRQQQQMCMAINDLVAVVCARERSEKGQGYVNEGKNVG